MQLRHFRICALLRARTERTDAANVRHSFLLGKKRDGYFQLEIMYSSNVTFQGSFSSRRILFLYSPVVTVRGWFH